MCSFVIKLTLSQISLILPKFTNFIFTTINTHISKRTQHLSQTHRFYQNQHGSCGGPKLYWACTM